MKKLIYAFALILLMSGCSVGSEEDYKKNVPYPESTEIIYKEYIDKGSIVIYKDESGFRHAFISKKFKSWSSSGNAELNPEDGFTWTMNNNPVIRIVTFAGLVTDDKISEVVVRQKTLENKVKVIEADNGMKIWFTYFDKLEESDSGEGAPLKIEALSSDGEILWKDGIYEGKFFHGSVTDK
jgi:hypothetical protein